MLHELLTVRYDEIVARARVKVAARRAPRATDVELEYGVPLFLSQLISILQRADGRTETLNESATLHGGELVRMGFTVAQVVHDYGDVCQVVSEIARDANVHIDAEEYRVFNCCLDDAIAQAVTEFESQRVQATALKGTEQIGVFAHEIRNLLNTAVLAFNQIKNGRVPAQGSTAAILERSFDRMSALVDRSLAEVRLEVRAYQSHPIKVAEFVEELEVVATVDAQARSLALVVSPGSPELMVLGDRALLTSAVNNLLQNAFKFTHPHSTVTLRVRSAGERVLIEVQDECGGLPAGKSEELFRAFEQRSENRSGVGLGLVIARRAVEASNGTLSVVNLPGKGCVFVVDLPRFVGTYLTNAQRS